MASQQGEELSLMEEDKRLLLCVVCKKLMSDPVLLACLHNCCKACLPSMVKEGSADVACAQCKRVTTSGAEINNYFVAARIHRIKIFRTETVDCESCKEDGKENQVAEFLCSECRKSLCDDCMSWHKRFNSRHTTMLLEDVRRSGELELAKLCDDHCKVLELMCMTCQSTKCVSCGQACMDAQHQVVALSSPDAQQHAQSVKEEIRKLIQELEAKWDKLNRSNKAARSRVDDDRRKGLEKLLANKTAIVEEVTAAHEAEEEKWQAYCDTLTEEAFKLTEEARKLDESTSFANLYIQAITRVKDPSYLLLQHKRLTERLEWLAKQWEAIKTAADELSSIKFKLKQGPPSNLEEILVKWIGEPRQMTEAEAAEHEAKEAKEAEERKAEAEKRAAARPRKAEVQAGGAGLPPAAQAAGAPVAAAEAAGTSAAAEAAGTFATGAQAMAADGMAALAEAMRDILMSGAAGRTSRGSRDGEAE